MIRLVLKQLMIPFKAIDRALPQSGTILDLGCGQGTVSFYLAQQPQRQVIGIDINKQRINQAKSQLNNQSNLTNLKFICGNFFNYRLPKNIKGCLIADVLHHLPVKLQPKILKRISRHLKPGGIIVIKEIDPQDMIRSKLSRLWDLILYPHDQINFISAKKLINTMEKLNFKVKKHRYHQLVPASINLYICIKQ